MGLKEYGYLILVDKETIAVTDEEKADMSLVKVHSSDNISDEGKREREGTAAEKEEKLQQNEDTND